jgi:hypothetical protein
MAGISSQRLLVSDWSENFINFKNCFVFVFIRLQLSFVSLTGTYQPLLYKSIMVYISWRIFVD